MFQTLANTVRQIRKQVDSNGACQIDRFVFNLQKDLLGQGSFGKVYRGYAGRDLVAIKVLDLQLQGSKAYHEALLTEVSLMRQLNGENVVKILDAFIDREAGELYLVLEYCDQGDLSTFLSSHQDQRVGESMAIDILAQIIAGLDELHKRGYVHRDIKVTSDID